MARFVIKHGISRDHNDYYFVDDVEVAYGNYDEHGSSGMEAIQNCFLAIANALKEFVSHEDNDDE